MDLAMILESTPESDSSMEAPESPWSSFNSPDAPPPVKIFVTGIMGYIGGTVMTRIMAAHPEFEVSALVRKESDIEYISELMPRVRVVLGELDDRELMVEECSKVKIVIQMATPDHQGGLSAIIEGLRYNVDKGHKYLIHTSDTTVLIDPEIPFGDFDRRVYDDIVDSEEISRLMAKDERRRTDILVLNAAAGNHGYLGHVRTAVICAPIVYGNGVGPGARRGWQLPALAEAILKHGKGFMVGEGKNYWSHVHIDNLAAAYLLLVEKAISASEVDDGDWDKNGYYFADNGEFCWAAITRTMTELVFRAGYINSPEVRKLTFEEADKFLQSASFLWGTNSRVRGSRLRRLGWNVTVYPVEEYIDEMMRWESEYMYPRPDDSSNMARPDDEMEVDGMMLDCEIKQEDDEDEMSKNWRSLPLLEEGEILESIDEDEMSKNRRSRSLPEEGEILESIEKDDDY